MSSLCIYFAQIYNKYNDHDLVLKTYTYYGINDEQTVFNKIPTSIHFSPKSHIFIFCYNWNRRTYVFLTFLNRRCNSSISLSFSVLYNLRNFDAKVKNSKSPSISMIGKILSYLKKLGSKNRSFLFCSRVPRCKCLLLQKIYEKFADL